jgi:hypothetical protein
MKKYLLLTVLVLLSACAQQGIILKSGDCLLKFGGLPPRSEAICNSSNVSVQDVDKLWEKEKSK